MRNELQEQRIAGLTSLIHIGVKVNGCNQSHNPSFLNVLHLH